MTLNVNIMSVEAYIRLPIRFLSLTIYELLANKTKCKKFYLENEGQAGKNGTYAIRLEMFVSILVNFS